MISPEVYMDVHALKRQGLSNRAIARKLGLHRQTVKRHLAQKTLPAYTKQIRAGSVLDPYRTTIAAWLKDEAYQATRIFKKVKELGYPGGYDQVKRYVREVKGEQRRVAYLRFETEPGRQVQMDWGEFQIREPDGRSTKVYALMMVLGYSRALYVEFVPRCTLEAFMDGHIRAFEYFGGVSGEVVYDNMKRVVLRRKGREVEFNLEFLHFARHYGFTPRVCPPYGPWVKGKVERPIHYVREQFWRGYAFGGVEQANRDVRRWLEEEANRRVHGTHHEPIAERWEREKTVLGPLPLTPYDTAVKVYRTVSKDCRLSYDGTRYPVPHPLVGRQVMLKVKGGRIRIFDGAREVFQRRERPGWHQLMEDFDLNAHLIGDPAQRERKYGRRKGKATRGLAVGTLWPEVACRPLVEYERIVSGGGPWNS